MQEDRGSFHSPRVSMSTALTKEVFKQGHPAGTLQFQRFEPGGFKDYIAEPAARQGFGYDKNGLPVMFDLSKYVSFRYTIATQGNTGGASTVRIYLVDIFGNDITGTTGEVLRVRVCDSAGYATATNATIAAGADTTNVTSLTSNKDLVLTKQADFWTVTFTNATAETATLRVGVAPLTSLPGDYTATQNVTHAAP